MKRVADLVDRLVARLAQLARGIERIFLEEAVDRFSRGKKVVVTAAIPVTGRKHGALGFEIKLLDNVRGCRAQRSDGFRLDRFGEHDIAVTAKVIDLGGGEHE